MDTIFALSTARGKGGVAVIRVSGPLALSCLQRLTDSDVPAPRKAVLRRLYDPADGLKLDEALVLVFEGPHSFTGEDIVELQTHGSIAVVDSVLLALAGISGCRAAEAGEFTRRALMNDRVDLAQVEGLADLINAETRAQQQQALKIFDGSLSVKVARWRADLLHSMALMEATIDFADEEVPVDVSADVLVILERLRAELTAEIDGARGARKISSGFEVAIIGAPNTGKSTLLNRLAGREAAIVSDIAGTTRDVVEVRMDLGGLPVTFLDTAGIRNSDDQVESIGIDRARKRAELADLRVFLGSSESDVSDLGIGIGLADIVRSPKSDLRSGDYNGVSGMTGDGVDDLLAEVGAFFQEQVSGQSSLIRSRHQEAVVNGLAEIDTAFDMMSRTDYEDEIVSEHLRRASHSLGTLVGVVGVEDVLGEVFASFCIGK